MAESVRRQQFTHVEKLRNLISKEQLVLFIGEELSILEKPASLDDWWHFLPEGRQGISDFLFDKEEQFVLSLPNHRSKEHDHLRMLGRFPLILTTNLDLLIERLLWKSGPRRESLRLDQVGLVSGTWTDGKRDLVVKCFGDHSYAAKMTPEVKSLMFELCEGKLDQQHVAYQFMQKLFNERNVLFLGCNKAHPLYQGLVKTFVIHSEKTHYWYNASAESKATYEEGNLVTMEFNMPLWEFTLYLSTGSMQTKFESGQVWERFFLATQRENYLLQQLELEKQASEIIYMTSSITNALATIEVIDTVSKPKVARIFEDDPFGVGSEEKVEATIQAMLYRRENLIQLIKKGETRVRAVFLYHEFKTEIDNPNKETRQMMIRKYADALLLCNSFLKFNSKFDMIMVQTLSKDELEAMKKETYAYIQLKEGADVAICYADTAVEGEARFTTHMIVVNGAEVQARKKHLDQTLARAWDAEKSLMMLVASVLQANKEAHALSDDVLRKLEHLDQLQGLTESHAVDLSSLELVGSGSFGSVYKGQYEGQTVAFKLINEKAAEGDLETFVREYDTMKYSRHPHIVHVEHCFHSQSRFGLIMEFIDGRNLWQIIQEEGALSRENAHKCAKAVGSALDHLHSKNIMHRDVKPDNVLIGGDFEVIKLSDFGLARATESTIETKTVLRGAWRYMAPEVMVHGKYSTRADVYSYGCLLIEVVSGRKVFGEIIDECKAGHQKLQSKPKIPGNCKAAYGEGMQYAIESCIIPDDKQRPTMKEILDILEGGTLRDTTKKHSYATVELLCLGTGGGITGIVTSQASSAFVVIYQEQPLLLVDLGYGVCRQYMEYFSETHHLPDKIFITHNHGDHAAELPPLLFQDAVRRRRANKPKTTIYCGPEVEERLKKHRLNEISGAMLDETIQASPDELADWMVCSEHLGKVFLDPQRYLSIKVHRSKHSEPSYGFTLYWRNDAILGFTSDSGFDESLYNKLHQSKIVLIDSRLYGSPEHASFQEVFEYENSRTDNNSSGCGIYLFGYGTPEEAPPQDTIPTSVSVLSAGMRIPLWPRHSKSCTNDGEEFVRMPDQEAITTCTSDGYPTLDGGTLKTQTANGSKARVSADEGPPPDDLKAMSSAVNEANPSGTPEEIGKTPYPSLEAQLQSHSST